MMVRFKRVLSSQSLLIQKGATNQCDCVLHPQNSAQNPLIVRADIHGRLRGYMRIFRAVVCEKS